MANNVTFTNIRAKSYTKNTFYNFLLKILEFSDSILSPNFLWKTLMFLRSAKTASLDSTTLIFLRGCKAWEWSRLPSVLEWCSCCGVLQFCFASSGFPSLFRGWSFSSFSFWFSLWEYRSVSNWMSQRLNASTPSQTLSTALSGSSSLIFSHWKSCHFTPILKQLRQSNSVISYKQLCPES